MRIFIAQVFSLSLIVTACSDLGEEPSPMYYQDDIREAFFRYQFEHNYSGIRQSAAFYALASAQLTWLPNSPPSPAHPWLQKSTDLPDEFMKRFEQNNPPVTKYSECFIGPGINNEITVWDPTKTKRGLLFKVSSIFVTNHNSVRVYGGYYENPASFSVEEYYLSGSKHTWAVDSTFLWSIG